MPEGYVVVWCAAGYVWTEVKKLGWSVDWLVSGVCVCVCVCVYWQEVQLLTEGLSRA